MLFLYSSAVVLMYFEEAQVKSLVLALREHFPGAELVCDAFSPFLVWANNLRIARTHIGGAIPGAETRQRPGSVGRRHLSAQ